MKDANEGSTLELLGEGLSAETPFDPKQLRNETDAQSQRPVSTTEKVKSDRGSFTSK